VAGAATSGHMGPVLSSSPINLYLVWYGLWNKPQKQLIKGFLLSLSPSTPPTQSPSVSDWWRTISLYTDQTGANVSRKVLVVGEYSDLKHSQWTQLTRLDIQQVIATAIKSAPFPVDHSNGVYLVLSSTWPVGLPSYLGRSSDGGFFLIPQPEQRW
jgi:hypothetical protein